MTARPQVLKVKDAASANHVPVGSKQLFERSLERERGRCYDIYSHTTRPFGAGYRSLSREASESSSEAGSEEPGVFRRGVVEEAVVMCEGQDNRSGRQLLERVEKAGVVKREVLEGDVEIRKAQDTRCGGQLMEQCEEPCAVKWRAVEGAVEMGKTQDTLCGGQLVGESEEPGTVKREVIDETVEMLERQDTRCGGQLEGGSKEQGEFRNGVKERALEMHDGQDTPCGEQLVDNSKGNIAQEERKSNPEPIIGQIVETEVEDCRPQLEKTTFAGGQAITNAKASDIIVNMDEVRVKEEPKITNTVEGYKDELNTRDSIAHLYHRKEPKKFVLGNFYEEEYSYEPESELTATKLVLRARSLLNLVGHHDDAVEKGGVDDQGNMGLGPRRTASELNLADEIKKCTIQHVTQGYPQTSKKLERQHNTGSLSDYLENNSLKEFLVNNNVVIVETSTSEQSVDGCRITSATVKPGFRGIESNTLPRARVLPGHRRVFYHPIRVNRELIDTELPDPDKVRSAREVFQKVVTFRQPAETTVQAAVKEQPRTTPEVRVVVNRVVPHERTVDVILRHDRQRKRWTDTGSLSSGVSSDMSCDLAMGDSADSHPESFSSEDEAYCPDGHLVAPEVLNKIRACGTTVTYYGGKVVARSAGPLRSPMTMSIMDEIRDERSHGGMQYDGIKFRLVKSNSCGSRLELAGTESFNHHHQQQYRREKGDHGIGELTECGEEQEEEDASVDSKEALPQEVELLKESILSTSTLSWKVLIDQRKQLNREPICRRPPVQDMEFEEFQVLEDVRVQRS